MPRNTYRITEIDLETLERETAALMFDLPGSCNNEITRKRWEEIKRILSDVRWDYGPYKSVETISDIEE